MTSIEMVWLKQCFDYTPDASEKTMIGKLFINVVFRASRILLLPFEIELISLLKNDILTPPSSPSFFTLSYLVFRVITRRRAAVLAAEQQQVSERACQREMR